MPQDVNGDDIGPTGLCNHHRWAITSMAQHGHVNPEATTQAAADIRNQCCAWRDKENQ